MMDLPPDVVVECRVINGEPEVFLSIEGSTFHLHPWDAHLIALALGHFAREAHEASGSGSAEAVDAQTILQGDEH